MWSVFFTDIRQAHSLNASFSSRSGSAKIGMGMLKGLKLLSSNILNISYSRSKLIVFQPLQNKVERMMH